MRVLRSLATTVARTQSRRFFGSTTRLPLLLKSKQQTPLFSGLKQVSQWSPQRQAALVGFRNFSSTSELGPATGKLRDLLEDYRQQHFGSVLFSRFVRQMVSLSDANNDGVLNKVEFRKFLKSMEITSHHITDDELDEIYVELKAKDDKVDLEDIENLAE